MCKNLFCVLVPLQRRVVEEGVSETELQNVWSNRNLSCYFPLFLQKCIVVGLLCPLQIEILIKLKRAVPQLMQTAIVVYDAKE